MYGEIANPVLRGFNPDPCITRVGDDFFVATSTFEWFPGVQIWHSRDLRAWRRLGGILDQSRLLDLAGVQSSGGVWAPDLSWYDQTFYLVYTTVRQWRGDPDRDRGAFKDTPNWVITAPEVTGPWSDPVYLNGSGFDPSLFHDDDGRSWLLNMLWDYRDAPSFFRGIVAQQFDRRAATLVGPVHRIFDPTDAGFTEAPRLYARDGWYYLVVAEGGTGYDHAVTMARARTPLGPYELHPSTPFLTSLDAHDRGVFADAVSQSAGLGYPVDTTRLPGGFYDFPQKAGHASMCRVTDEVWALVHLSARVVPGTTASTIGRETSIQRVVWGVDGWPYVVDRDGTRTDRAQPTTRFPELAGSDLSPVGAHKTVDNGSGGSVGALPPNFFVLRRHPGERLFVRDTGRTIRIVGSESPVSLHTQSVVARPITDTCYAVEVCVAFDPADFQQMAGLVVRYDERNQYFLRLSADDAGTPAVRVLSFCDGRMSLGQDLPVTSCDYGLRMGFVCDGASGRFYLLSRVTGARWWENDPRAGVTAIGPRLDMLALSDERVWPMGFTGTFVGMACHDVSGRSATAEFRNFVYTAIRADGRATVSRSSSCGSIVMP